MTAKYDCERKKNDNLLCLLFQLRRFNSFSISLSFRLAVTSSKIITDVPSSPAVSSTISTASESVSSSKLLNI